MRKQPWFYLFVFGLALLLAVYMRLTMAERAEDFYLFPDAQFWLFLEALLVVHLLDRLHGRASRRGQASGRAGYYFGLLWRGAALFVGLVQLLQVALTLTHLGRGDYQFLLQRRFGAAYAFEEDVQLSEAEQLTQLVPPDVLQELLTNAVKHNLASRQQPLAICLTITPAGLRLAHPRRPRPTPAEGTGSGLPGLRARLALLTDWPLVVEDTGAYFAVTVPLLAALPTPVAHAPAAA